MIRLVSLLIQSAIKFAQSRGAVAMGTGIVFSDFVNLDWLRQQSIKLAPGSDQAAIEEAARTAARLLGMSGDEVLWPSHSRGPNAGEPIVPRYLTIDLNRGRAWYSSHYYSKKSTNAAFRRGRGRGYGRGVGAAQRAVTAAR